MFTLLVTLAIVTSILLILVILVQSPKEGLHSSLSSTSATQFIGLRRANSLLEQITWILIITLFTLILATSSFLKEGDNPRKTHSPNIDRIQERSTLPDTSIEEPQKAPPEDKHNEPLH